MFREEVWENNPETGGKVRVGKMWKNGKHRRRLLFEKDTSGKGEKKNAEHP